MPEHASDSWPGTAGPESRAEWLRAVRHYRTGLTRLEARGRVIRAGRTITVCHAEASMRAGSAENSVATMLATIMTIRDRPDVVG